MAKVVVIDDEPDIRKVLTQRLQREGYEVVSFDDAAPALESPELASADVIMMDLVMPTPGVEAVRTLRDRGIQTPVMVLSGYLDDYDEDQLQSLGVDRILHKPFRFLGVLSALEQLL